MKFKRKKIIYSIFLLSFFIFSFFPVLALDFGLDEAAKEAGIADSGLSLPEAIGVIMGIFLSFLGMIFFILLVYGGFLWMTSRGNENQLGKAKTIIGNAIWGLIIVLMAYVISSLIVNSFTQVVAD